MEPAEALKSGLAELVVDPANVSLFGKVKQLIQDLGTEGQGLVRAVSSLISMPSEMKWKEQRGNTLENALKAIESMAEGEEKGLLGLFRKKEGMASASAELEEVIRELQKLRESIKNDGVSLRIELEGIERQAARQQEVLSAIEDTRAEIIPLKGKMAEKNHRDLLELLDRKSANYSASHLAALQTKGALELLIRNNALLMDNLNDILSVLPDISQLGLIVSRLRSGDTSEISRYRNNLRQVLQSFH